jgi:hypothetical protein
MNTIIIYGEKYNVIDRIAHAGDLIITNAEKFDHTSSFRTSYDIAYNTPYEVCESYERYVHFRNKNARLGSSSCLAHKEYFVIELAEDVYIHPIRHKLGEEVIVKKFLGITFYRKVITTYNYKYEEE